MFNIRNILSGYFKSMYVSLRCCWVLVNILNSTLNGQNSQKPWIFIVDIGNGYYHSGHILLESKMLLGPETDFTLETDGKMCTKN